jgi:hypothetical protein
MTSVIMARALKADNVFIPREKMLLTGYIGGCL